MYNVSRNKIKYYPQKNSKKALQVCILRKNFHLRKVLKLASSFFYSQLKRRNVPSNLYKQAYKNLKTPPYTHSHTYTEKDTLKVREHTQTKFGKID